MSTQTDGLMNEEHWQRVRAAQVTQPSQTDDLEAMARAFVMDRYPDMFRAEVRQFAEAQAEATIADCAAFARSLAQPPSSELIDAAQAVVERWDSPLWKDLPHTGEFINRLRAALAAHPKDPVEDCDYRKFTCAATGSNIGGVWVCDNHRKP